MRLLYTAYTALALSSCRAEIARDLDEAAFNASVLEPPKGGPPSSVVLFYSDTPAEVRALSRLAQIAWEELEAEHARSNLLVATVHCNEETEALCARVLGQPHRFPFPSVLIFTPFEREGELFEAAGAKEATQRSFSACRSSLRLCFRRS